jgi:hypothetical protein
LFHKDSENEKYFIKKYSGTGTDDRPCFVQKVGFSLTKVTPSNLDSIASNYYEQYLKLYPLDATSQGDTRYNDQLPINIDKDLSPEKSLLQFCTETTGKCRL